MAAVNGILRLVPGVVLAAALCLRAASASDLPESVIKAAGLFKVVSFVEWPPESFATPHAPLVVGVLGDGPIADLLPAFAETETWNGRKVVVRGVTTAGAAAGCHVVFVGRSAQATWTQLRPDFSRRPILTFSEADDFARHGGIVQLAIARNRLHLVINVAAARAAGITISSKVLRLAEVVGNTRP